MSPAQRLLAQRKNAGVPAKRDQRRTQVPDLGVAPRKLALNKDDVNVKKIGLHH